MRELLRASTILFLVFGVMFLAAAAQAQTRPPIVEELAKTYGLDSYGQIDAVRYTFNLELPALNLKLARTWTWEPKTGQVTYETKDKDGKPVKVNYNRNQLNSAPANVKDEVDPAFTNDNYWFIFPFHVYWDTSANVTVKETQKLPIGAGTATLVSVKYPAEVGGYTPGDTWDLYVGKDGRVVQFIYRRGGPKKPSNVTTTWTGYKKAGPLLVSNDHRGTADGKPARIFFTDVAVKVAGSDKWVDAQ
ncbi:MAG TPA: hypothetical protein VKB48_06290 [Candidatus Acidoferrum sp.]|nr:hypothetical protein [Candidatus Acidoferrum sp.]